jgi:hypothetical protein
MTQNQKIAKAKTLRQEGWTYRAIAIELGVGSKSTIIRWLNPDVAQHERRRLQICNHKRRSNPAYRRKENQQNQKRNRRRYHLDVNYRCTECLRSRVRQAIKRGSKAGSAVRDLGCSIEQLKQHLETQFRPNMTWDNYGQWHIDHITPLSNFDLTDREQFLEACHFTNLQPLWAVDNLIKSNKQTQEK